MSPAAVDLIKLPPLDPPTPSSSPSVASRNEPSFQDHLERVERRSDDSNSARSERKEAERPAASSNGSTEARSTQESSDADKPNDKQSDETQAQSETVGGTKEKSSDGDQDADSKQKDENGADAVVAVVAAPQAVDATKELMVDAVEISGEVPEKAVDLPKVEPVQNVAAVTKATAEAAIVVQAAATEAAASTTKEVDPEATTTTPAVQLDTELAAAPVAAAEGKVEPTGKATVATEVTSAVKKEAVAVQPVAEVPPVVAPTAASTVATAVATPEPEPPVGDEKTETKTDATADAAPTVEAVAQQIVAAVEATVDVTTSQDESSKKSDEKHHETSRVEGRGETTRTDRPHQPEPTRHAGREVGGTRGPTGDGSTSLSQSDRVRLVERVARAVRTAEARGGDLKIRLSPPELGSLRLQVKLADGTLSARIEAETPEARQVLVDNLPQLREKLSDQNIRVEKFDIDLFNSGNGGAPQQSREEFDRAMFAAGQRRSHRETGTGTDAAVRSTSSRGNAGTFSRNDGRLDITI